MPFASGPYLMDKAGIDTGKQIMTLTRNPKWWGEQSKLDRIIVQVIGNDPAVSVSALRNNEVQMIYPQPQLDLVKQIKSLEPTITSSTNFGLSFEHLDFNTKDELLGEKVVRQAFAYALNRPDIVAKTVAPVRRPGAGAEQPLLREQPARLPGQQRRPTTTSRTWPRPSRCSRAPASPRVRTASTEGRQAPVLRVDDHPGQPAAQQHDRRDHPAAEAGRHRDQEVPQPRHLRGQGEAAQPRGWPVPDRPVRLGRARRTSPATSRSTRARRVPTSPRTTRVAATRGSTSCSRRSTLRPTTRRSQDLGNQVDKLLWDNMVTIPLYQKPTFLAYNQQLHRVPGERQPGRPAVGLHEDRAEAVATSRFR